MTGRAGRVAIVAAAALSSSLVYSGAAPAAATPGKDGVAWYRPSDGSYHVAAQNGETAAAFAGGPVGDASVTPLAVDWNGDAKDGVGWYRPSDGSFHLVGWNQESTPPFIFGPAGDSSVTAIALDWNGDGKDGVAWYRPSDGSLHIAARNGETALAFVYGPPGDSSVTPVAVDWNGDGKDGVGWYRPSDGSMHIAPRNGESSSAFVYGPPGVSSVTPVGVDWNGDGRDGVGWYRPSDASMHIAPHNGETSTAFVYGPPGDSTVTPLAGNWNGDGGGGSAPPPRPNGLSGLIATFGEHCNPDATAARLVFPWANGNPGGAYVNFHPYIAGVAANVRNTSAAEGKDGAYNNAVSTYNCRLKSEGGDWSVHAFGAAFDINSATNPRGATVWNGIGGNGVDYGSYLPTIWQSPTIGNFDWGLLWDGTKDPMHFQYVTGY